MPEPDRSERAVVALPPLDAGARQLAAESGFELSLFDPEDADQRAVLIGLAHPELADAIEQGHDEVTIDGQSMNPRLHLTIHEVVATQIIDADPAEVFETATRLLDDGRDRHEVLHMLGSVVAEQIWSATHEQRPYSRDKHIRALAALPDSWDSQLGPPRAQRRTRMHGRRRRRRRS